MECPTCGSEKLTKLEDEKFVLKTYKCERGHKFEITSSGAKAIVAGGFVTLLVGLVVAILTDNDAS